MASERIICDYFLLSCKGRLHNLVFLSLQGGEVACFNFDCNVQQFGAGSA